ncbi:MAG: AAA family ATPase, partial [Chloroflexia bacterium]|nr:AAA family ATPase [Chloroflexia bacterium]
MINKIQIENFKSIENLTLEPGRLNIVIGANASGKTNILEAIVMGALASSNKLDYEFLGNRIRVTSPEFMKNAFPGTKEKSIQIEFSSDKESFLYSLINDDRDYRRWIDIGNKGAVNNTIINEEIAKGNNNPTFEYVKSQTQQRASSIGISDFLIYTPELSYLRKFEEQAQITPLGIKGEGLFYVLKRIISDKENKEQFDDIKEYLHLLDWFEDFNIPSGLMPNEYKISIKDRFIDSSFNYFDQRSSNEGFLYLLFYLVLFTSKNTPSFFAIDNIETGFNPKLCTELIKTLNNLSEKYQKQVILTTHNPAILDGLNLNDDNQRLFISHRNKEGKTNIERI